MVIEPEDKLIKSYVKGGQEIVSLSVFSRPHRATLAEDSFTNKQMIDDNYKSFALSKTEGLFNPKLQLEHRKQLLIAKIEADKLAKKTMRSVSVANT